MASQGGICREEGGGETGGSFTQAGGFGAGGADLGPQSVQPRDEAFLIRERGKGNPAA